MKYHFFTIPVFSPDTEASALNAFLVSHRIVHIEKEFVGDGGKSFWAFCIQYLDSAEPQPALGKKRIDYKESMDEQDFAVFVKLRDLRKQLSEKEGVPPYAIFTNEQLAQLVQDRVTSLTGLENVKGIGAARIEKYGKAFLEILIPSFRTEKSGPL